MRHISILVISLATACSGVIDGGNGDDDDVPTATDVEIVVKDGALPKAGVRAIFQNADDSLIIDVETDAAGFAQAEMPDGGTVTIIRSYPAPIPPELQRPAEVYTYLGVKAGDRLELGRLTDEAATPTAINVVVPETANGNVTVQTACGTGTGAAPNVPITVIGCPANMGFYVMDQDNASFFVRAPYSTSVDVSLGSFRSSLGSSISAVGVPLGTTVSVERRLAADGYTLYSSGAQRVEATPANINVPQLDGVDNVVIASITSMENRSQMVSRRTLFAGGPTVVDASVGLIANLGDLPVYAPTGITWVEESPGVPDMVVTSMAVTRGGPPNPNNQYVRTIIAPYTGTSIRMPILPGSALIFNPTPIDEMVGTLGVVKVSPGGYDAVRARAFTAGSIVDLAPMDGELTLSYAGNTPPTY